MGRWLEEQDKQRALSNLMSAVNVVRPRLLFSMDATASRQHSWAVAQDITRGMFDAVPGQLDIALAYHRGGDMAVHKPYSNDKNQFLQLLSQVQCEAGRTAMNDILFECTMTEHLKAVIYVGDCYEEPEEEAYELAGILKDRGTKCFLFHEDNQIYDSAYEARNIYERIVAISGGAVFDFNSNAPAVVSELIDAIALYAILGPKGLLENRLALPGANKLLSHLK